MNIIKSILSSDQNSMSSVRFAFLFSVIVSNLTVFGLLIAEYILKGSMQTVPDSVLVLYCAANGIGGGVKLIKDQIEKVAEIKKTNGINGNGKCDPEKKDQSGDDNGDESPDKIKTRSA